MRAFAPALPLVFAALLIAAPRSYDRYQQLLKEIQANEGGLEAFSQGYNRFGFHRQAGATTLHEWLPGANAVHLMGISANPPTHTP